MPASRRQLALVLGCATLTCLLGAALVLAGCAGRPFGRGATRTDTTVAGTGTAATVSAPVTPAVNPDLPRGMGYVYAPTQATHPEERAAILGKAHAYLGERNLLLVNEMLIQEPYALSSVVVKGTKRTWVFAMKHEGDGWFGVWKSPGATASRQALEASGVVNAPELLAEFDWRAARYGGQLSKAAAAVGVRDALNKDISDPSAVVHTVRVTLLIRDIDGSWWAGGFVDEKTSGGMVFAHKLPGDNWRIIDFGTGIDGTDLRGKAPVNVTRAFVKAFKPLVQ